MIYADNVVNIVTNFISEYWKGCHAGARYPMSGSGRSAGCHHAIRLVKHFGDLLFGIPSRQQTPVGLWRAVAQS